MWIALIAHPRSLVELARRIKRITFSLTKHCINAIQFIQRILIPHLFFVGFFFISFNSSFRFFRLCFGQEWNRDSYRQNQATEIPFVALLCSHRPWTHTMLIEFTLALVISTQLHFRFVSITISSNLFSCAVGKWMRVWACRRSMSHSTSKKSISVPHTFWILCLCQEDKSGIVHHTQNETQSFCANPSDNVMCF